MKRRQESGFALLLVFVMAAAVAIGLYYEMPRVAFESQRTREQMLINRGLQYQRGIQLFYRKYRTYPQTLDDLETTRNIRFLRRRYKDPLTGKDEWRLIHVGPTGALTDSLVQPANPLGPDGKPAATGLSATGTGTGTGTDATTGQPGDVNSAVNMALRRPSDRVVNGQELPPGAEVPPDPNQPQPQQPLPGQPGYTPPQPGQPGYVPQPGQPGYVALQPGQPGQPPPYLGQPPNPSQPQQYPPPQYPGQPIQLTNPATGQPYSPSPGLKDMPPGSFQQPGGFQPNQGSNLIQQILTTPRQASSTSGGVVTGGGTGIAGVASTAAGQGIHRINDRAKYKEWEFVYDLKNDKSAIGQAQQMQQLQQMQPVPTGQAQPNGFGANPTNLTSPPVRPITPP